MDPEPREPRSVRATWQTRHRHGAGQRRLAGQRSRRSRAALRASRPKRFGFKLGFALCGFAAERAGRPFGHEHARASR